MAAPPPIEIRRKKRKKLGAIPPFIDMAFPSDVIPNDFFNYSGLIYDNPTFLYSTTVKSGKSNSSDWRLSGGIDGKNNVYRYSFNSNLGQKTWNAQNFRFANNNFNPPSNPPSTVDRPSTNPINSAKLICETITGKSCCWYRYYDAIGLYIGSSGLTCSS